jgi:hypothetical protein
MKEKEHEKSESPERERKKCESESLCCTTLESQFRSPKLFGRGKSKGLE